MLHAKEARKMSQTKLDSIVDKESMDLFLKVSDEIYYPEASWQVWVIE